MSFPAKSLEEVQAMDAKGRTEYFESFSRFIFEAPKNKYAIRVGSRTLTDSDTYSLRLKFDRLLRKIPVKPRPINCTLSITSVEALSRNEADPKIANVSLGTRVLTFQWTGEPEDLADVLQRIPNVRQLALANSNQLLKD